MMCEGMSSWILTHQCVLVLFIYCMPICQAFLPNFWSRVLTLSWDSYTHQYMTEQAILNITMETLSKMMEHQQDVNNEELYTGLGRGFWHAVGEVASANAEMDFLSSTCSDPVYHFDSERVEGATQMLREFWGQTVLLTQAKEYQGARRSLGQLFHSLQDFYSHSNWVEMGQQAVYLHLLHPEEPSVPVASEETPTCAECYRFSCYNNLLEEMIRQTEPLLTTGYFSAYPVKPPGKCSHGGILDSSRHQGAEGGINKDSTSPLFSPHHYLHKEAAHLATTATLRVLQDLRNEVGPNSFLRLFSVQQPPALVFVMDTTGSMFEEITAARLRALSIIQAREKSRRTSLPGTFILVPFHDPGFGPVMETDNPYQFMQYMEDLTALGGGDEPEMCLSALQLALTHSPPLSEIFVFTDASPKDHHLQSAVQALILEKQTKVNFLLTEDLSLTGRGKGMRKRKRRESLSPGRFSLYSSLSSLSGGMTIFTTKTDIRNVSAIVEDTTTSSKVTLLHAESESKSSNSFRVDKAVTKVMLHITGQLTHCELVSPSGVQQSLPGTDNPLAVLESSKGLNRISLLPPLEIGIWQLTVKTIGPMTFNVLGDSSLDFLYYFAREANETHPGLRKLEGSPIAGVPVFLVVAVTGMSPNEEASFSHVTLLGPNRESLQKVLLNSTSSHWSEEELVGYMDSVPRMPFSMRLCGMDRRGNLLERVSTEMIQPTHVQIQVHSVPQLLPGHSSTVLFEIFNHGPSRHFKFSAKDDQGYLSHPDQQRLFISARGSVKREVELRTPHTAQAGTAITLTLIVHAEDLPDSNYAVVHLAVILEEPDKTPPACSSLHVESSCPSLCSQSRWKVSFVAKDRGHSGLASIQLAQGEGTLILSEVSMQRSEEHFPQLHEKTTGGVHLPLLQPQMDTSEPHFGTESEQRLDGVQLLKGDHPVNISEWSKGKPVMMRYSSGCCAPHAKIVLWDRAGNMRHCHLKASQERALREKNKAHSGESTSWLVLMLWGHLTLTFIYDYK
ncbi:von Willebrand factor A domain-containing protein 7 [Cyprinus carpio]|uniref:von Willebrand factor A domain-containing protein 7 n=1 Tax=Cyprinus carpio TaxID=7962 RepID=A0A9R0AK87_CYPCA|nr:von Willebrand factor A domain-containing protein 7 [Cyprinus carpio]XP_042599632.1 von Willebrand factor A domain-containing protein 7 [Cyprinus carpio]